MGYMGVSLNGGTVPPISHPKRIIFSRKNPWLLGPTILGNPYIIYTFIYYYVCVFVTGIRSFASTDVGPGGFFAHPNGTLNEYTAVGQN